MRKVAIDGTSCIYQFLKTTRINREAACLRGFLYRTLAILEKGFLPIYCFDGEPHPLKHRTKAKKDYSIIAMEMLQGMGVPAIRAPHDGEAQCAAFAPYVDFVSTMDIDDAFAFGATKCGGDDLRPKMNKITILSGKARVSTITFRSWLQRCNLPITWNRETYVDYRILLGTDFNEKVLPKGSGRVKAIKLLAEHTFLENTPYWNRLLARVKMLFLNPPTHRVRTEHLIRVTPNLAVLRRIFLEDRSFKQQPVERALARVVKTTISTRHLDAFFVRGGK
jgi:5'-3' exonuclease